MSEKDIIIQILKKLQWHRDLADGLLALVESVSMKQEVYDALLHILHHAYKTAQHADQKAQLQKSVALMQRIHAHEHDEQGIDNADVARLLDEINHA